MRARPNYANALLAAMLIVVALFVMSLQWIITLKEPPKVKNIIYRENAAYETIKTEPEKEKKYTEETFETSFARYINRNKEYYDLTEENKETIYKVKESVPVKALASEVPINYTELVLPNVGFPVYVFMDNNGKLNYRVMIERTTNNTKERGYVTAKNVFKNKTIGIDYDQDAEFVNVEAENYGEIIATEPDEDKVIGMQKVFGKKGVYEKTTPDGKKEYYVYGHYVNGDDSFFMADKEGNMIKGTLPIEDIE